MGRNSVKALLAGAAAWAAVAGLPGSATAQTDCETIPAGPARTDCYIALSRIYRQKSDIAASVARQQSDIATYRRVTGRVPRRKDVA